MCSKIFFLCLSLVAQFSLANSITKILKDSAICSRSLNTLRKSRFLETSRSLYTLDKIYQKSGFIEYPRISLSDIIGLGVHLDVSTGGGALVRDLRAKEIESYGTNLELSEKMIQDDFFIASNSLDLSEFRSGSVDIITEHFGTAYHYSGTYGKPNLDKLESFFMATSRVLRKDGLLIIMPYYPEKANFKKINILIKKAGYKIEYNNRDVIKESLTELQKDEYGRFNEKKFNEKRNPGILVLKKVVE